MNISDNRYASNGRAREVENVQLFSRHTPHILLHYYYCCYCSRCDAGDEEFLVVVPRYWTRDDGCEGREVRQDDLEKKQS